MTLLLDSAPTFLTTDEREDIRRSMESARQARPEILTDERREESHADWILGLAILGAIVAITGLALAVVIYICSVCAARSYSACIRDIQRWWGAGC